jgi:hypothetical protein
MTVDQYLPPGVGAIHDDGYMGFFSWMSSCGTVGEDEPPSLIRYNDEDSDLNEVRRAAAEDVARVEQDDKYFGRGDQGED